MLDFEYFSCNGELLKTYKDCYFIHFEYQKESSVKKFFGKVTEYIKAFDSFTNQLAKPFGMGIEINLELQSLENGSLRVWLKDILEKINDEDIRRYVNSPIKEPIIDFIKTLRENLLKALSENKHDTILKIHKEAFEDSPIARDLGYSLNENSLLQSLSDFSTKALDFEEPPTIHIHNQVYTIKSKFPYTPKEQCDKQTLTTKGTFLIKKPDLQGSSQWELIADKIIKVKISDDEFLQKLKNRDILIGYGDKLQATMETTIYIYKGEIRDVNYTITKVEGLLETKQKNLF